MLKMLEKLINEHGSSVIFKERLELFSGKYSLIEKENSNLLIRNSELTIQVSDLEVQNQKLESHLNQAKKETRAFNGIIDTLSKTDIDDKLGNISQSILEKFFENSKEFTVEDFMSMLSLGRGIVEYHFDLLVDKSFIEDTSNISECVYRNQSRI